MNSWSKCSVLYWITLYSPERFFRIKRLGFHSMHVTTTQPHSPPLLPHNVTFIHIITVVSFTSEQRPLFKVRLHIGISALIWVTIYYTCQLSHLRRESHACELKTSISRRLTLVGQFLTPDWKMWVVAALLDTVSKNMLTQTHVRN